MTAVDIFTASRMKQIEDTTVVSGLVDVNGNLLLKTRDGTEINAGVTRGPSGPQGNPGVPGPAGSITSATASGLAAGAAPTITLGGTPGARTFAFGIPKGDQGIQGIQGVAGVKGDKGDKGDQGIQGIQGVKGDQGIQGPLGPKGDQGIQGTQGTVGPTGPQGDATLPAGTISLWGSDVAPSNWLICDGSAISRTTYASLFAVIGTKYGAGDGSTTFNLPNLKGRAPFGKDSAQTEFANLAQTGGEKAHLLTAAEMPSHSHTFGTGVQVPSIQAGASSYYWNAPTGPDRVNGLASTATTGGGAAHNILPPYEVVNFIIKVSNGDTPGDSQLTTRVGNLEVNNTALPAGTISLWGSDVAPTNWMLCDGSAISRTTYASLFNAIGIKYGAGDGVNTFNLPNLKGRSPVGYDSAQTEFAALGQTGGEKTHLLTINEMPSHTHSMAGVLGYGAGPANSGFARVDANSAQYAWLNPGNTGGGAAHNVLQPYQVVNFIIKVSSGTTTGDSELATRIGALETNYSTIPAGTVTAWAADVAPANWLICDGAAVSRATYASLFAVIGTKYGVGDGTTTFNLPNFKGRVPVGKDTTDTGLDTLGKSGGVKTHVHYHANPLGMSGVNMYAISPNDPSQDAFGANTSFNYIGNPVSLGAGTGLSSGALEIHMVTSSPTSTFQPFQIVNYIIKFTNGDTKADSQLTQRVSTLETATALQARTDRKVAQMQAAMTGGGNRSVTSTAFNWGIPFRLMGSGVDDLAPAGYFNVTMPPDGTVIPVVGSPTVTSVTVAGGKIDFAPLSGYSSLYYRVPWGLGATTVNANFFIVDWNGTAVLGTVPQGSVFIVARVGDNDSPRWKWGDGRQSDDWKNMGLANGWVGYQNGYGTGQWRWTANGEIELRGLIANGSPAAIAAFGADQYPDQTYIFTVQSNAGTARIDMPTNGQLTLVSYSTGGSNAYVSLVGIRWRPAGA